MLFRFLIATTCLLGFTACNPNKRNPTDPATLQTPAGEAALRYMIDHCPLRAEAKLAVIGVGELLAPPQPAFVERFRDISGLTFIDHRRVVAGMVGGKSRRFDESSGEPVLELQIGSLTETSNGSQEAVAAWAFKDDAVRKRLEVKPKAEGGYDIREIEDIPVPRRNDDTRSAAGK